MEWANKMVASGVLRQILQGLGGSVVGAGLITAEQNTIIAGAVASLIAVGLDIVHSRNVRNELKSLEKN
jgi:tetrahydromethanopterin S-methyltransferase subunit D